VVHDKHESRSVCATGRRLTEAELGLREHQHQAQHAARAIAREGDREHVTEADQLRSIDVQGARTGGRGIALRWACSRSSALTMASASRCGRRLYTPSLNVIVGSIALFPRTLRLARPRRPCGGAERRRTGY
jgi:hypothetical protein